MNLKLVLPLAVLGVASLGAAILVATSSPVVGRPSDRTLRAVRVVPVEMITTRLEVRSQGTVSPRTESELILLLSGRSPSALADGTDPVAALVAFVAAGFEGTVRRA